jgi:hypothetical protein
MNCAVVAYRSSMQRSPPVRRPGSGACPDIRRSNRPCATTISTHSVSPDSMSLSQLNPVEPPYTRPVCPVVWEGWRREVSPYPDPRPKAVVAARSGEGPLTEPIAGVQPRPQERVLMPLSRPCRGQLPRHRQPGVGCPTLAAALRQRVKLRLLRGSKELDVYERMLHETDLAKQRALTLQYNERVLDEETHYIRSFWWNRLVPCAPTSTAGRSARSHYSNQDLGTIWLSPPECGCSEHPTDGEGRSRDRQITLGTRRR